MSRFSDTSIFFNSGLPTTVPKKNRPRGTYTNVERAGGVINRQGRTGGFVSLPGDSGVATFNPGQRTSLFHRNYGHYKKPSGLRAEGFRIAGDAQGLAIGMQQVGNLGFSTGLALAGARSAIGGLGATICCVKDVVCGVFDCFFGSDDENQTQQTVIVSADAFDRAKANNEWGRYVKTTRGSDRDARRTDFYSQYGRGKASLVRSLSVSGGGRYPDRYFDPNRSLNVYSTRRPEH